MTQADEQEIAAALDELDDYAGDVMNASYQTVVGALQRFQHSLRRDGPLGDLMTESLPKTDFSNWYPGLDVASGRGTLEWPSSTPERLALQAELIRRMAEEEIDVLDFAFKYTYTGIHHDTNIEQFVKQVFGPFARDLIRLLRRRFQTSGGHAQPTGVAQTTPPFIDPQRISALEAIDSADFDLSKLIMMCKELDSCFSSGCYLAVAALTRSLLDHVPPIFQMEAFKEVANNYGGTRSFKASMQHLEGSARTIGDTHLHTTIRRRETLPTPTQVNFANDLDVLLGEIARLLK